MHASAVQNNSEHGNLCSSWRLAPAVPACCFSPCALLTAVAAVALAIRPRLSIVVQDLGVPRDILDRNMKKVGGAGTAPLSRQTRRAERLIGSWLVLGL